MPLDFSVNWASQVIGNLIPLDFSVNLAPQIIGKLTPLDFSVNLSSTVTFGGLVNHLWWISIPFNGSALLLASPALFLLLDQHSSGLFRNLSSTSNLSIDATVFFRKLSFTSNLIPLDFFVNLAPQIIGKLTPLDFSVNLSSAVTFGGLVNHLLMD